ncbi:hypothetical protein [Methanohalophilus sp.]
MQRRKKLATIFLFVLIVFSLTFSTFYRGVSLDAEVPAIPTDQLLVFQGNSSSHILYVDFVNSTEEFNSSTDDICFLVVDGAVEKTKLNTGDLHSIKQAKIDNSDEYIIQQMQNRSFITENGNAPMSSLGKVKIVDVEFVYFDNFESYPYKYEGETRYYPAWKITSETSSGYGDITLMAKATHLDSIGYPYRGRILPGSE